MKGGIIYGSIFVEHGGKVHGDIVCKNGVVVIENGGYVKGRHCL